MLSSVLLTKHYNIETLNRNRALKGALEGSPFVFVTYVMASMLGSGFGPRVAKCRAFHGFGLRAWTIESVLLGLAFFFWLFEFQSLRFTV